ncbi:hypothetical protein EF294_03515 [Gordonia oryzae]|uniref:CBM-cenC domain-containing protein n=1 Tax=Gordonia oryzae TaxID=2487349 RepID=A0A3N4GWL4_9ACTN|nr:alanine-zipper protein [Gordonia oryzae]RPA65817.1 hypothetical protein EF294_03515 [Gordonia oryzae]
MTEPSSILNGVVKTSWPSDMLPSETSNVIDMLPAIWKAFFLGIVGNIAINIANAADIDGLDPLALLRQWGQEQEQAASNALAAANSAQTTATSAQSTANNASTTANTANTTATNALSAAQNALQNAENALGQLGTLIGDVLGGQSTAADLAAFITGLDGIIDPSRIAQVSASAIGAVGTPNLLTNGSFVDSVSMAPEGSGWTWDGTTTHSNTAPSGHTDGSVTTTGTGVQQTLVSNVVAVSAGQSLSVAGWLKWSGVTASGSAFSLNVISYLDGNQLSHQTIGSVVSPSAAGSWQEITGTYTVPSGADQVRVQLVVTANVTAGQVWWDDLSLTKTQTIDQSLITDLENALSTINSTFNQIGQTLEGEAVTAISTAVTNVQNFAASLTGWQSTTTANAQAVVDGIINGATNASGSGYATSEVQAAVAGLATGYATPAYVSNLTDMATVPRQSVIGWSTQIPSGCPLVCSSSGLPTFPPQVDKFGSPGTGTAYFTPIVSDRKGTLGKLRFITGADGALFSIDAWFLDVYVYSGGTLTKVTSNGNLKSAMMSSLGEQSIDISSFGINVVPAEILFVAHLQQAPGLAQTARSYAAAPNNGVPRADVVLQHAYYTQTGLSTLPQTVSLSSLTGADRMIPWAAVSVVS